MISGAPFSPGPFVLLLTIARVQPTRSNLAIHFAIPCATNVARNSMNAT